MNGHVFHVSLSIYHNKLERDILDWLQETELISNDKSLTSIQNQRIISFAAYLFPEIDKERLSTVMKFFTILFLLDDLLDKQDSNESLVFLERILLKDLIFDKDCGNSNCSGFNERLSFQLLRSVQEVLKMGNVNWQQVFDSSWEEYLSAQIWEVRNKKNNRLPSIPEYQEMRLKSSGVYLALELLKVDWIDQDCSFKWIERVVGRQICLSNDIQSMPKEKRSGDFHNELLLLKMQTGCSDSEILQYSRRQVQSQLVQLDKLLEMIEEGHYPKMEWKENLLLMVGGCNYWAEEDTLRYSSKTNGKGKC